MTVDYLGIGKRIRLYRQIKKFSQEELAFRINTSPAYISNVERGTKKPSLQKLIDISDILGITVNDLVYSPTSDNILNQNLLNEQLSVYDSEKKQLLLNNLSSIIETIITQ